MQAWCLQRHFRQNFELKEKCFIKILKVQADFREGAVQGGLPWANAIRNKCRKVKLCKLRKNWRRIKFSPPVDATPICREKRLNYISRLQKNRKRILFTLLIGSRSYLPKLQRRKC